MNLLIPESINEDKILEPYGQKMIYLLLNTTIKALQFEQKRAFYLMLKAKKK